MAGNEGLGVPPPTYTGVLPGHGEAMPLTGRPDGPTVAGGPGGGGQRRAPSITLRLPSGALSLTVVDFWMAISMQTASRDPAGPSYRVTVTDCAVCRTLTRSRTWHGSTPDHQTIVSARPSREGLAFSHRDLARMECMSLRPGGRRGGRRSGRGRRADRRVRPGRAGRAGRAGASGPEFAGALGAAPHPSVSSREPAASAASVTGVADRARFVGRVGFVGVAVTFRISL